MIVVASLFLFFIHQSLEVVVCTEVKRTGVITQLTSPVEHGEGPHWSTDERVLYFVSISEGTVHRYDPANSKTTSVKLGGQVGAVIPVQGKPGQFVAGRDRDVVQFTWDGISPTPTSTQTIVTVDQDHPKNRFNDGKADLNGVFWFGTMGEELKNGTVPNTGSLYKIEKNDCGVCPEKKVSPVSISNGIAWSPNNTRMYYIDSPTKTIEVYNYDLKKGEITNRQCLFDLAANNIEGVPDGMTTDSDGNLWVAVYAGGQVLEISDDGKLLRSVKMPASLVSSVTWGGDNLETLFVTTIRRPLKTEELEKQPSAGALYSITGLGRKGISGGHSIMSLL